MGMFPKKNCTSSPYAVPNSNPNPKKFKIVDSHVVSRVVDEEDGQDLDRTCLVVKVQYPDAKNFEGMKIMVYWGITSVENLLWIGGKELDPHFSEKGLSPVARFPPTERGWITAICLAEMLVGE